VRSRDQAQAVRETFHEVREAGRVISLATVVAIEVTSARQDTVLGSATGPSEDHQFWVTFAADRLLSRFPILVLDREGDVERDIPG
jgi:transposase-like protein